MNAQRLYFDHDSSEAGLVRELSRQCFDCLVAFDAGLARTADDDQLRFAREERRILVTHSKGDFTRLHRDRLTAGERHLGIIVASQDVDRRQKLRRLSRLLGSVPTDEFVNRIEYLSRWAAPE